MSAHNGTRAKITWWVWSNVARTNAIIKFAIYSVPIILLRIQNPAYGMQLYVVLRSSFCMKRKQSIRHVYSYILLEIDVPLNGRKNLAAYVTPKFDHLSIARYFASFLYFMSTSFFTS